MFAEVFPDPRIFTSSKLYLPFTWKQQEFVFNLAISNPANQNYSIHSKKFVTEREVFSLRSVICYKYRKLYNDLYCLYYIFVVFALFSFMSF